MGPLAEVTVVERILRAANTPCHGQRPTRILLFNSRSRFSFYHLHRSDGTGYRDAHPHVAAKWQSGAVNPGRLARGAALSLFWATASMLPSQLPTRCHASHGHATDRAGRRKVLRLDPENSDKLRQGLAGPELHYTDSRGYIVDPLLHPLSGYGCIGQCQVLGETRDG